MQKITEHFYKKPLDPFFKQDDPSLLESEPCPVID